MNQIDFKFILIIKQLNFNLSHQWVKKQIHGSVTMTAIKHIRSILHFFLSRPNFLVSFRLLYPCLTIPTDYATLMVSFSFYLCCGLVFHLWLCDRFFRTLFCDSFESTILRSSLDFLMIWLIVTIKPNLLSFSSLLPLNYLCLYHSLFIDTMAQHYSTATTGPKP